MSLLRRIFGSKSPTRDWIADPTVPLHVDLDSRRFCGVELGAEIERLKHLGPSSDQWEQDADTRLLYKEQGFQLFLDERQCLKAVDIDLVAVEDIAAFTGSWSFQGQPVSIEAGQTPAQIEALLGLADHKDETDCAALCYRHRWGDIWFEWGETGDLECVLLDKSALEIGEE